MPQIFVIDEERKFFTGGKKLALPYAAGKRKTIMGVAIASVIVAALKDVRLFGFSGISALILIILLVIHLLTRK